MTDKLPNEEPAKRRKGSLVERVAKRVSGDLSANITRDDSVSEIAPVAPPAAAKAKATSTARANPADSRAKNVIADAVPPVARDRKVMAPAMESVSGEQIAAPRPAAKPPASPANPDARRSTKGRTDPPVKAPPARAAKPAKVKEEAKANEVFELDFQRLSAAGFITPGAGRNRKTEEYRLIKRALLNQNKESLNPRSNLIVVTSALPNEGKTFTAVNLAISIAAEENKSVLLIDADFNKRGALEALGMPDKIGLIDVLERPEIDLGEVIVKTNIPNLSVVPAGQPHKRSTELLASARMAELAAEIGDRYENRLVLFDCPPLLATTEAAALTAHIGQVLFVVRADSTKEMAVRQAIQLIDAKPKIGLILSRIQSRLGGSEYGGSYQSYYGYYGYGNTDSG
jgi:receptor protein-tyrosine kinase